MTFLQQNLHARMEAEKRAYHECEDKIKRLSDSLRKLQHDQEVRRADIREMQDRARAFQRMEAAA